MGGGIAGNYVAYGSQFALLTTKGDVLSYSTTPTRLAVGANGKKLAADSTATEGVAWVSNFKLGTYTGNGASTQAITGVGFAPKFLYITIAGGTPEVSFSNSTDVPNTFVVFSTGSVQRTGEVNSHDADGFTVSNANNRNNNLTVYTYVAFA